MAMAPPEGLMRERGRGGGDWWWKMGKRECVSFAIFRRRGLSRLAHLKTPERKKKHEEEETGLPLSLSLPLTDGGLEAHQLVEALLQRRRELQEAQGVACFYVFRFEREK